ncbi:hypothetical protein Pmi06nite_63080 [Planotetraspora mira]|uniref:Uncharacterized protein n=1 Tax=Planotetraspora mira TaxID=58121 RepID=A0A8J3TVI9_9ACTN|nr:hypothetical protein Pmi06nite_63080 [Planotetraspora mira]
MRLVDGCMLAGRVAPSCGVAVHRSGAATIERVVFGIAVSAPSVGAVVAGRINQPFVAADSPPSCHIS